MINKRIATAIATGALVFNSLATPAFAAINVNLTGNGDSSNNTANLNISKSNSIVQNNTANISNNVEVDAETGGNEANRNTGGDVNVETGNSTVGVSVQNALNKNSASLACCTSGNATLNIPGNGVESDNDIDLDMDNSNEIFQDNDADVDNDVDVWASTGNNEANRNTGGIFI